ncbi:hypothetical protein Tco_1502131 [Tanacetum coccineum]
MASHHSKSLYAIKECSTCGRLYTRECCSIGNLEDKILVPVPDSSPRCARCGTPVDGPSCRGCAFLRKKFDEDLLAYCVENGIFQDFQNTSESSDDNTNVVNALREPCVVNQDPGVKSSQDPPQIDHNCCYECGDSLDGIFCQQCICKFCGKGAHYGYNCPPKVPIISNPEQCNQTINELPQILPNENSFIYNSKPHSFNVSPSVLTYPPQLQFETYLCELCGNNAHYGYDCSPQFPFVYEQEPFSSEKIDEEYERDCEIRIRKLKQDFNIWGSEVRKKEQAYEEEKYSAACRYMLSITCDDKDDYIPSGDIIVRYSTSKHLDTIPATELDEVIKSSVENLVPIPSEFEVISDDTSTLLIEEFAGELTHIAPIPPGIVEADFDPNDDISSDDDSFENIEYVDASPSFSELDNVILREKLLNVHHLISKIEYLKDNPTPGRVFESPSPFPIPVADSDSSEISLSFSDNSLPEFKSFSDHTEETRSGSTTTHANYSLPEYESFHFDNPSLPRPPSEPLDVCLDMLYNDESFEPGEGENIVVSNVEEDDSFTFTSVAFQF